MISRRTFLGSVISLATGACFPRRVNLPVAGANARSDADIRIVFFTDIHTRLERGVPEALKHASAAINSCVPDVLIGGGDFITEGLESSADFVRPRWELYRSFHDSLRAPVHPTIGNHDLVAARPSDGSKASAEPRAEFLKFFKLDRTYRSFDAGGLHFIILDSVELNSGPMIYSGRIAENQLEWIRQDLSAVSSETPIVLVSHVPLLTGFFQMTEGAEFPIPQNRIVTNNREVLSLFENHTLMLVLQGHLHVNELLRWRDTTFVTGGAVCAKWWKGTWHGTSEGFGVITVRKGRVEWEYKDYGWHQSEVFG